MTTDEIARQLNEQSRGPRFEDLSDRIEEANFEIGDDGLSVLDVVIADPCWVLPTSGFLGIEENGEVSPIELDWEGRVWTLRQVRAEQGRLVLAFD